MPRKTKTTPRSQAQASQDTELSARVIPESNAESNPPPPRRAKREKPEEPDAFIEQDLLDHPERMNYLLLLAFLKKHDGRIEFKPQDVDISDEDWNIAFARSLDGKRIVVSIVSVQSGILKTPQKGKTWQQQQQDQDQENQGRILPFIPMPLVFDRLGEQAGRSPAEMLTAATTSQSREEKFLQENDSARAKMPPMPFEVGHRPESAGPMDLGAFTRENRISETVAAEEAAASERVEAERQ